MTGRAVLEIGDDAAAHGLAEHLNRDDRTRPAVVVSTPAGHRQPRIDVAAIHDEVGDLAEVYLIHTGPHTWAFSRAMADGTQVYGGAGRVYPVGLDWVQDIRRSPLRFAFDAAEGRRATQQLIGDAFRMASDAGLLDGPARADERRSVTGSVVGFPHEERAMVKLDDSSLATVSPELLVPGLPLDRLLVKGMRVSGDLDVTSGRLDLRSCLLDEQVALSTYAVGDVVLAKVSTVSADLAELTLHPEVTVAVVRRDVTSNDRDDLRSLLTQGEVLPARVAAREPSWRLRLDDVDDDEVPLPAPALLEGGPPWLVESTPELPEHPAEFELPSAAPLIEPTAAPVVDEPAAPEGELAAPARPSPRLLDPKRRHQGAPETESGPAPVVPPAHATTGAVASLSLKVEELRAEVRGLKDHVAASEREREMLLHKKRDSDERLRQAQSDGARLRRELRKAKRGRSGQNDALQFADREQGFRHAVLAAWARRTSVAEQPDRPLEDYELGPHFLDSLELPDLSLRKVADVVVEVLTGLAHTVKGRDLHQVREGPAGSPYVRRDDGATCWRAAIQVNTPQARRLHYWQHPGGRIELSRVVLHDDMDP